MYGSSPYATPPYGAFIQEGGAPPNPNVDVDLTSLGTGGRLNLVFGLQDVNPGGVTIDLDNLGDGGHLIIYFNRNNRVFADAGELWKRVPRHSQSTFYP